MNPNWFLILYSIIAVGTLGLYLLLPKDRQPSWFRIGAAMAGLALIALLIALLRRAAGPLTPQYPWFTVLDPHPTRLPLRWHAGLDTGWLLLSRRRHRARERAGPGAGDVSAPHLQSTLSTNAPQVEGSVGCRKPRFN